MERQIPKHTPFTAAELVETGWVARVRQAVLLDGNAVCIGEHRTIKAQVINHPGDWRDIMLPNGGVQLTDHIQCALVIDMLEGKTPIPDPKKP